MNYASWGQDSSDVTLVRSTQANRTRMIECVGCSLTYAYEKDVITEGGVRGAWVRSNGCPYQFVNYDEVLAHLQLHRGRGDTIPDYVDIRLTVEHENPTEAWLP